MMHVLLVDGRIVYVPEEIVQWYQNEGFPNQVPTWIVNLYTYDGRGLS
jgi:uncharacterized protein (DUF3820 family)